MVPTFPLHEGNFWDSVVWGNYMKWKWLSHLTVWKAPRPHLFLELSLFNLNLNSTYCFNGMARSCLRVKTVIYITSLLWGGVLFKAGFSPLWPFHSVYILTFSLDRWLVTHLMFLVVSMLRKLNISFSNNILKITSLI